MSNKKTMYLNNGSLQAVTCRRPNQVRIFTDVVVTAMCLLGASLLHRPWQGTKLLNTMVTQKNTKIIVAVHNKCICIHVLS